LTAPVVLRKTNARPGSRWFSPEKQNSLAVDLCLELCLILRRARRARRGDVL